MMSLVSYILVSLFTTLMHPLHMSVTNVEIVNNRVQVSCRLFKDDLALALRQKHNLEINWLKAQEWVRHESAVCDHVMASMLVHPIGEKAQMLTQPTLQVQKETIEITWTLKLKTLKEYQITNFLLLDIYPDQRNLVVVIQNSNELGISFNHEKTCVVISNGKIVNEK
ncbi:MAG: DUF6702 family protein [Bacteroidota bacterium]